MQASAHTRGAVPRPPATATTAALFSSLAPVELSLHRGGTKSTSSPGSLSRCVFASSGLSCLFETQSHLAPSTKARPGFSVHPCHSLVGAAECQSNAANIQCSVSLPSEPSLQGCWVQNSALCRLLGAICGAPFSSLSSGTAGIEVRSWRRRCIPDTVFSSAGNTATVTQ